ncbi:hypothetical protein KY290_000563 [Solanum tuberosum]|uniref:Uncharacterized protein n=1 Tax=Solanum tuberosum TaxID=4113 RepID=A0ABQ7WK79_SOLTU|nr:hypothetical protein KY290_000563 [Solanum tuberosum]
MKSQTRELGGRRNMGVPFILTPSTQTTTPGGWVHDNGCKNKPNPIWITANPKNDMSLRLITIVNGILFAGSVAPNVPLYTMDVSTGKNLVVIQH